MLSARHSPAFATANYKHIGLLIGGGLEPSPDFLNAAPSTAECAAFYEEAA